MKNGTIVILLVDDNTDFVNHLEHLLQRSPHRQYTVVRKKNSVEAFAELANNLDIDVIITEYFLPDTDGKQLIESLSKLRIRKPVIILTKNKDFDIAVEMMKLDVAEYLVKEELTEALLSKTITMVLEKLRLQEDLMNLEISKHRLEAMRDMVNNFLNEIAKPAEEMERLYQQVRALSDNQQSLQFLTIMQENIARIATKIEQLRTLNKDKTVKYIKDIRMIDLS